MNLRPILDKFSKSKIFVIGDLMVDQYIRGSVNRISPEAPVPILKVENESFMPGGAANVATNINHLGAKVYLFGLLGKDTYGNKLISLLKNMKVDHRGVIQDKSVFTTLKTRIIADNQQVARIDKEKKTSYHKKFENQLLNILSKSIKSTNPDAIIISDYCKGTLTSDLTRRIISLAKKNNIFIAVDPKGSDYKKYHGADVITPNIKEAEIICGFQIKNEKDLKKACKALKEITNVKCVIVTRGNEGISYYSENNDLKTTPANTREVYDVTGAGDTVVSVLILSSLHTGSWDLAVEIANKAAGIVVERFGTSYVTQQDLIEAFDSSGYANIYLSEELPSNIIYELKQLRKKIVFTNGCFDLFHFGHLSLLKKSRELGDYLVVGINSDKSVRRLKGTGRPIIKQYDRAKLLNSLECVDLVVIFVEDTPLKLIKMINPDIIVKGGDYSPEKVIGKKYVEGKGGKVVIIPLVEGISTTNLLRKLKARDKKPK